MIASRRIFIVSSSHPYHNCKIPFPIRARNDTVHDTQAPKLLIPIIHLITRIYLAYRLCTKHVHPPFAFRINQGRPVPCLCHHRSSAITFSCEPFDNKPKVLYHQVTFRTALQWVLSIACCISCTIRLWFLSYLYQYLLRYPWIFILFRHLDLFHIPHSTLGCLGRFLW